MKQAPGGSTFITMQMKKVDFQNEVLQRLQDDVGTILTLIDGHNAQAIPKKQRGIGFWASLRMLLPIVEAVSHVMGVRPEVILRNNLNISAPYLVWHLFRHSLTHGDYIQQGTYRGKTVTWEAKLGAGGHTIQNGHIAIDIHTLYNDLVSYLQDEIAKNDQTLVGVEIGIDYQTPIRGVVSDFASL